MSLRIILSTLLSLFVLSACQVKETESSSGLISGHTPVTNRFTLQNPTAGTYTNGQTISFTLTFPFHVAVTGVPQLTLTVGGATPTANYVSGDGTSTLTFEYAVAAGHNDNDGIRVNSLILNGGTLTFLKDAVSVNCDLTLASRDLPNVRVDNTAPTISSFALTTPPGFYHLGQKITFHVTYSEAVYVTGLPSIELDFTTGPNGFATYAGGHGTTVLSFEYTILANNADLNGYAFPTPSITGGTIRDASGIAAASALSTASVIAASNLVEFNGMIPYVVSVTPPANGTYVSNTNLDFVVEFDRTVTVSSDNYLELAFTSGIKQATYLSGSGSNLVTFRYTTIPGDEDADGIAINRIMGGTITAGAANFYISDQFSNSVFYPAIQTGIILNSPLPQVTAVSILTDTSPALNVLPTAPDGVFIIGETMDIVVNFNVIVKVIQTIGTPYIDMTIGGTVVRASYLSGDGQTSLVFRYTILEGQSDTDGVTLGSSITLNGGTITDQAVTNARLVLPTTSFPARRVDGIRPVISSMGVPANGTYSTATTPNYLEFNVNWSEAVNYSNVNQVRVPMTIGSTSIPVDYNVGNNTALIRHRYVMTTGLMDTDGITLASPLNVTAPAQVRDLAGNAAVNTFTVPNTTGILVDSITPTISSVVAPLPGRYRTGDQLNFTVNFSEAVTIASGTPSIGLRIGTNTRAVANLTPGTASSFTFRYVVQSTDTGAVSIPTASVAPNSSTIRDTGRNDATLTFSSPTVSGIIVDEVAPLISSATTTAGTYVSAGGVTTLNIDVTYDDAVTISGTAPYIELSTGAVATRRATYNPGGSSTTMKRFSYTVQGNDMDLDGIGVLGSSIVLPGGTTMRDANANDAEISLPSIPDLNNVFFAPYATIWMKGSTTNHSGISGNPTITTTATMTSGYYEFNGSETISLSSSQTMRAAYLAMKAPNNSGSQEMLTGLTLSYSIFNSSHYSLSDGRLGAVRNTTGATSTGSFIDRNLFQQVELQYNSGSTSTTLISNQFRGSVAEVIIFSSSLDANQLNHVYNYLNSKYITGP